MHKAEFKSPELDAAMVDDLVGEMGEVVAHVGGISSSLALEGESDSILEDT